jgi:AcrR family transcriptional regulator
MTVVAARHGYAEASVARVIKQAGMSRATFYEHFEDRDDCFLAAFRSVTRGVRDELEASERLRGAPERPRDVLCRTLVLAERFPAAAQVMLIEARAGDATVRAEHEELLDLVETAIDRSLEAAAERGAAIEIPVRALLGGIVNLVGMRVFRHEAGGIPDLLDDLLIWFASYSLPPGDRRLRSAEWAELGRAWNEVRYKPPPPPPRPGGALPRGRSARPPGPVASEHREQALGLERSAALAAARFFTDASWPERVWNSAVALVEYISEHAGLAHAAVLEAYAAGPAAIRRSFESRMAYTLFLEDGYRQRPEAEALPRICGEAIAGGIEELLRNEIVAGRTERAQELVPQAAYVALAPFLGAEAALEFVSERCRRPL